MSLIRYARPSGGALMSVPKVAQSALGAITGILGAPGLKDLIRGYRGSKALVPVRRILRGGTTRRTYKSTRRSRRSGKRTRSKKESVRRPASKKSKALIKTGKKKQTKVSRNFKQKVIQAMKAVQYKGEYLRYDFSPLPYGQNNTWHYYDGHNTTGKLLIMNSPNQVMDAFSILWNNRTRQDDWASAGNRFTMTEFKAQVSAITCKYTLRNNTQRKWYLRAYDCVAKQYYGTNPLADFQNILAEEATVTGPPLVPGPNIFAEALTGGTHGEYYCRPGFSPEKLPAWRKNWKYKITDIILDPGQDYVHSVHCGSYEFIGKNQFNAGAVQNYVPRQTIGTFFAYHPELELNATSKGGMGTTLNDQNTVNLWRSTHYHLICPDYAAPIVEVAAGGGAQEIHPNQTNKQDAYAFWDQYNWDNSAATRIDVLQPTVQEGTGGLGGTVPL